MRNRLLLHSVFALALFAAIGCGDDDDTSLDHEDGGSPDDVDSGRPKPDSGKPPEGIPGCTANGVKGLAITVVPESGWSCEDLEITATDGGYTETLDRFDCSFSGAPERAGTYDVRIEGYGRSLTIPPIHVVADRCHVSTESRRVQFNRACTEGDQDAGRDEDDAGTAPDECVEFIPMPL